MLSNAPNWEHGAQDYKSTRPPCSNKAFRNHRGAPPFRHCAREDKSRGAPAVVNPFDGRGLSTAPSRPQLSVPDMRLPIAYALGETLRLPRRRRALHLSDMATLTFEEPDEKRFPYAGLAHRPSHAGGNTACGERRQRGCRSAFSRTAGCVSPTSMGLYPPRSKRGVVRSRTGLRRLRYLQRRGARRWPEERSRQAVCEILIYNTLSCRYGYSYQAAQLITALVILVTVHEFGTTTSSPVSSV